MRDQLQAIIDAKTEDDILDAFDNYLRDFQGINSANNHLIYSNLDALFSKPELHAIKSLDNAKRLGFISIQVNDNLSEKSGKKSQYDLAKTLLKENERYFDYGIFLFYDTECNFRYSLIFNTIQENKRAFNTYKRYTYFVDNTQPNTTFLNRIAPLQYDSLEKIVEAFSVEKVNEEFYRSIANWFHKLVGAKTAKKDYETLFTLPSADPETNHKLYQDFAVRLIGRIVFVWFLKFKKDTQGKGLIPDELISNKAVQQYPDYYHHILEKVFFEILNKKKRDAVVLETIQEYVDNIPYLNGGLFEPLLEDYYEVDMMTGYSEYHNTLRIDDGLFTDLFSILEQYNFTIDENSASDIEVSVDPEMLGRIFENLLGEINPETGETARKSTGSFYTPRSIVEYMVRQTLLQYLEDKTDIKQSILEELCYEGAEVQLKQQEVLSIIQALDELKILDPACGSGAYPMGILQQILIILKNIDSDNSLWLDTMLATIPDETMRNEIRANTAIDYIRKLGVIQRSIFGVDIQESAVEISRLRFFLSLIVDQSIDSDKKDRGIQALPNLDFKFVSANTLISLPKGGTWEDSGLEDQYIKKLKIYFGQFFSSHGEEKKDLAFKITQAQKSLANTMRKGSFKAGIADKIADWEPFSHKATDWFDPEWMFGVTEGFDIVIGNPPYIGEKGHKDIFEALKKSSLGEKFYQGKMDIFYFFFHIGLDLLKPGGVLSYITTNYFTTATGGTKLRLDLKMRSDILELINFGELKVFKSAAGQHNMITILQKKSFDSQNKKAKTSITQNTGYIGQSVVKDILELKDHNTEYFKIPQDSLYDKNGYIKLTAGEIDTVLDKMIEVSIYDLGNICNINQGIVTGADKVTAKHLREHSWDKEVGDGIFVLSKEEVKSIKGKRYLKNWYKNSDIKRFNVNTDTNQKLLYIDNDFDELELDIVEHLEQFKKNLQKRREVHKGSRRWFELWRAREEHIFEGEKIVSPQRSKVNTFGYNNTEWYAASDVFFITKPKYKFSLKVLVGILNSKIIYQWLYYRGKRKGYMLELTAKPLSEIPIPDIDEVTKQNIAKQIEALVDQILEAKQNYPEADTTNLESQIDELVMDLYDLTEEERDIVRGRS